MTPENLLYDRLGLKPITDNDLISSRAEYANVENSFRVKLWGTIITLLLVMSCLALFGDTPRLSTLPAFVALCCGVAYWFDQSNSRDRFNSAARKLKIDQLPPVVLDLHADDPDMRTVIENVLKAQDGKLYYFQVEAIIFERRKVRAQKLSRAIGECKATVDQLAG